MTDIDATPEPIEGQVPGTAAPGSSAPAGPPLAGGSSARSGQPLTRSEPRVLGPWFWLAIVAGAIAVDLGARHPFWNNVAASVAVVLGVAGLLASGRFRSGSSRVALGLAALLGAFLWVRTNPALLAVDMLAIMGLIWVAAVHNTGRSMWDSGPLRLIVRGLESLALALETLFAAGAELNLRRARLDQSTDRRLPLGAVLRGVLIAGPVVVILGLLLASGDAVFASFFSFSGGTGPDLGQLVGHAVLLALGAYVALVLLRSAVTDHGVLDQSLTAPRLGVVEALVVLVALDALFAVFGLAQLLALFGQADERLADAGLTVKQYARQGFFQLLWVAGLTALILTTLDVLTRPRGEDGADDASTADGRRSGLRGRLAVQVASLVAVALTLVIVAVAFSRLRVYIDWTGNTPLRFYSLVFSLWIGAVFVMLAVRLLGVAGTRSWLTAAVGLSAVVTLVALNIVNPEAIIARDNLNRDDTQLLFHLHQQTADGDVAVLDGLDRLDPVTADEVVEQLCQDRRRREYLLDGDGPPSGWGYNRSEHRREDLLAARCNDG